MATVDSTTLERLRQLLQDPAARAELRDLIDSAPGGSSTVSGALNRMIQTTPTAPGGLNMGAAGQALGAIIGRFLKRRGEPTGQPRGSSYNQPSYQGSYQGNTAGEDSPGVRSSLTPAPPQPAPPAPAPPQPAPPQPAPPQPAPAQTTPTVGVAPSEHPLSREEITRGSTVVEAAHGPNWRDNVVVARAPQAAVAAPAAAPSFGRLPAPTGALADILNAPPTAPAPPMAQTAPIGTGPGRLLMSTDVRGDPIGSTDGGKTWTNDRGQRSAGPVGNVSVTDIGNPGPVPINSITGLPYPSATGGMKRGGRLADGGVSSFATTSAPTTTGTSSTDLVMGSDARGRPVHSYDGGTTWVTDSGQMASGPIYNKSSIGGAMARGGRLRGFAKGGGGEDLPPPPPDTGRRVLRRGPPMGLPVLHTTIVIGVAKKKGKEDTKRGRTVKKSVKKSEPPEKKAKGGALKPHALPPKSGPGNGKKPQPVQANQHQRTIMPRGWGIEIRGRKGARIY